MKISSKTKISDLIKENGEAIAAIASINPHFNKLRNPILRKILASRVTIADAARIGNSSIEVFFDKLKEVGFEVEDTVEQNIVSPVNAMPVVIEMARSQGRVVELDVRESLSKNIDPFGLISEKLNAIPQGYVLLVINSFEPVPLIRIMQKRGSITAVETKNGVVYTYITRNGEIGIAKNAVSFLNNCTPDELQAEADRFGARIKVVDVREMEMPLPMVTILEELSILPEESALYVHHKKVPQHLLPELEERMYKVWVAVIDEGSVKLLIHK